MKYSFKFILKRPLLVFQYATENHRAAWAHKATGFAAILADLYNFQI